MLFWTHAGSAFGREGVRRAPLIDIEVQKLRTHRNGAESECDDQTGYPVFLLRKQQKDVLRGCSFRLKARRRRAKKRRRQL